MAFKHLQGPPTFKRVWNSKCTQRICFYMWLILVDRLNTKTMLRRRKCNVQPNVFCVMCVMGMWRRISITYFSPAPLQLAAGKSWASIGSLGQISLRLSRTPYISNMRVPFFIEIFIIASWELWCMRNRKIFDAARASINLNSRIKFCYNSTECEKAKFP